MTQVTYYLNHIAAYEREFKVWEGRVDKIVQRYRDEKRRTGLGAKFNVLWSNVQTLKSATFSRMPKPDVSRRFKDQDPVGRVAALILERALAFEVDHYSNFGASIRQCVYDRFLGGRGTAWVRYEPTFEQVQQGVAEDDGPNITEDVDSESEVSEVLSFEGAPVDYVHWRDFGHNVARCWEEVSIVWRRVYMTKTACKERFGREDIPLDAIPDDLNKTKQAADSENVQKRALIYEIWDKETGKAIWLSKSMNVCLDERDDPLGLEEFFPCPPPIFSTLTTDTLVPIPDFTLYQDQAQSLDTLADRIDGLVRMLQVKGVHDASVPELARLFTEGQNGDLIPVKNWAAFAEKQGLKGAIDLVEILPIAQALTEAYQAFEQVKNQIYELTGISDIIRGETHASETATAQQIKNNYASMRLKMYQDEVERFASRLLQLKAQIICNHFDPQTLIKISGADQLSDADKQLVMPAIAMLKDAVTRNFRIQVATDSMNYQDEQQEKADRMEFLTAVSGFLEKAVQAATSAPPLIPLAMEMLQFGVAGFRVGKGLEGTIDQAAQQLKQLASQPRPDPEAAKAQAGLQQTQMQTQADQAKHMAELQHQAQMQAMQQQHEQQMEAIRQQTEAREAELQRQHEAGIQQMQQQHAEALAQMQGMVQQILQRMKDETAIEVAEIGAETTLDAAQMSAAKGAD